MPPSSGRRSGTCPPGSWGERRCSTCGRRPASSPSSRACSSGSACSPCASPLWASSRCSRCPTGRDVSHAPSASPCRRRRRARPGGPGPRRPRGLLGAGAVRAPAARAPGSSSASGRASPGGGAGGPGSSSCRSSRRWASWSFLGGLALAVLALEPEPAVAEAPPIASADKRHLVGLFRGRDPRKVPPGETRTVRLSARRARPARRLGRFGRPQGAHLREPARGRRVGRGDGPRPGDRTVAQRDGFDARRHRGGRLSLAEPRLQAGRLTVPPLLLDALAPFAVAGLRGDRDLRRVLPAVESLSLGPGEAILTYGQAEMPRGLVARLVWGEEASEADAGGGLRPRRSPAGGAAGGAGGRRALRRRARDRLRPRPRPVRAGLGDGGEPRRPARSRHRARPPAARPGRRGEAGRPSAPRSPGGRASARPCAAAPTGRATSR